MDDSHLRMLMPPDVILAIDLDGAQMRGALVSSDGRSCAGAHVPPRNVMTISIRSSPSNLWPPR
jgi:hypothetical protein